MIRVYWQDIWPQTSKYIVAAEGGILHPQSKHAQTLYPSYRYRVPSRVQGVGSKLRLCRVSAACSCFQ